MAWVIGCFNMHMGYIYQKNSNYPLCLDKSSYENGRPDRPFSLDVFTLQNEYLLDLDTLNMEMVIGRNLFLLHEEHFHVNENALNPISDDEDRNNIILLLSGYWQSYRYFSLIADSVRLHFSFKKEMTGKMVRVTRNNNEY